MMLGLGGGVTDCDAGAAYDDDDVNDGMAWLLAVHNVNPCTSGCLDVTRSEMPTHPCRRLRPGRGSGEKLTVP